MFISLPAAVVAFLVLSVSQIITTEYIIKKFTAEKHKLVLKLKILTGQDFFESENCTDHFVLCIGHASMPKLKTLSSCPQEP